MLKYIIDTAYFFRNFLFEVNVKTPQENIDLFTDDIMLNLVEEEGIVNIIDEYTNIKNKIIIEMNNKYKSYLIRERILYSYLIKPIFSLMMCNYNNFSLNPDDFSFNLINFNKILVSFKNGPRMIIHFKYQTKKEDMIFKYLYFSTLNIINRRQSLVFLYKNKISIHKYTIRHLF